MEEKNSFSFAFSREVRRARIAQKVPTAKISITTNRMVPQMTTMFLTNEFPWGRVEELLVGDGERAFEGLKIGSGVISGS